MKSLLILCLSLVPFSLVDALALRPAEDSTGDSIEDSTGALSELAWLEGHWVGEGLGGVVEEVWLPQRGGSMMCMFRLVVDGRIVFYEFVTIDAKPEGAVMRLRHFDPDLVGWEEKKKPLVWPGEEVGPNEVRFGPVLYERRGDELIAWVELSEGEETKTTKISFKRVD